MIMLSQCSPTLCSVTFDKTAVVIDDIKTELVCTKYQDRVFLVVTQYNKIGTLVNITRDNITDETGDTVPIYSTNVLMGKDEVSSLPPPPTPFVMRDILTDETGDTVPIYNTNVLMGKDEPMTHVIAKNLVSNIVIQKPVLLSMALKDSSPNMVRTLAQILPKLL